jgi:hypothetical protein
MEPTRLGAVLWDHQRGIKVWQISALAGLSRIGEQRIRAAAQSPSGDSRTLLQIVQVVAAKEHAPELMRYGAGR